MQKMGLLGCLGIVLLVGVVIAFVLIGGYNGLNRASNDVDGKWANGKPLTAIPNFARMNRTGQVAPATAGGDSSVNYAPGSTPSASANTNSTANSASGQGQRRFRGGRDVESMVWIKE